MKIENIKSRLKRFFYKNFILLPFQKKKIGEKHIVKLLHFPNITPSEQKRLLMSDHSSGSGSDDEQERNNENVQQKTQRKKSSTKRSLDLQRKISQTKLREERKESKQQQQKQNNSSSNCTNHVSSQTTTKTSNSSSPVVDIPSLPLKHGNRNRMARNGKISGGYEQFSMSLLTVPMPKDYCDPSSDDLSSEWDSDSVNDNNNTKTNGAANKESKVRE